MSVDKLVDSTQLDADLTSVANAIRTKGGTSTQLAFPADFVTAINAISGGGGTPTITALSAVYTQVGEITTDNTLSDLIPNLVVTATINDSLTIDVAPTDYTLSGTLAVGTSTITVSCGGEITTFTVSVTSAWDYEWNYTDGVLTENGWTRTNTSAVTEGMGADGVIYSTTASDTNTNITPTTAVADAGIMNFGVMEVVFSVSAITNQQGFRIRLSNGTNGIGTLTTSGMLRLYDNPTLSSGTALYRISTGTFYKVKLVLNGPIADVYVNDQLAASTVDITTIQYANATGILWQLTAGAACVKSIRMKIGRIS